MRQLLNNKQTAFIKLLTDTINKTNYFKQVQGQSTEGYMNNWVSVLRYSKNREPNRSVSYVQK